MLRDTVDMGNFVPLFNFSICGMSSIYLRGKQHLWNVEAVIRILYGCF